MNKLIEVVQEAGRNGVAVGHFNIADLVLLKGVFPAAVMVGASEGEREFAGTRLLAAGVRSLREEFDLPIFLNADHTHLLAKALKLRGRSKWVPGTVKKMVIGHNHGRVGRFLESVSNGCAPCIAGI